MSEDPRHKLPDRLFHWIMAALVIILLVTAFLPILGIKFNWVTTHWIAGVFLIIATIFHLYRSFWVHGITEMLPTRADLKFKHSTDQKYDLNHFLSTGCVKDSQADLKECCSVLRRKFQPHREPP